MVWLDTLLQGLLLGGFYSLLAAGLSLAFGVMRIINLAHGDLAVLGAYLAILAGSLGLHPFLAILVVLPVMGLLGYAIQTFLLNRLVGRELPPLLVTLGLAIITQNLLLQGFTADPRSLQIGSLGTATLWLGKIGLGVLPLLTLLVALLALVGLQLFLNRTSLGRAFRAAADDPEVAQVMGVNVFHVYALAMGLATAIVALGGIFLAIRANVAPLDGPVRLLYAFEAVIIGGLGSVWGTLLGGLVLGLAQVIGYGLNPGWGILMGHFAFLAVLLLRPQGLFTRGGQP